MKKYLVITSISVILVILMLIIKGFIFPIKSKIKRIKFWTRIRTNNVIERLNREIRRRTRVVGTFPDGNSALMLVCARLRHVAGTQWGNKKYMNMKHLENIGLESDFMVG